MPPTPHPPPSALEHLYRRGEHYAQPVLFILGFAWDALTISRIDNIQDHVFITVYLAAVGAMIYFMLRRQLGVPRPRVVGRIERFFPAAIQFTFGGMFSSFVIFYFRSVSWSRTAFFFGLLVALFIANEFLRDRLGDTRLLAALYFFCLSSYLALLFPTLFADIGTGMYLMAGLSSILIVAAVMGISLLPGRIREWRVLRGPAASMLVLYALLNLLYFNNLIPPVPLAMKSAGIYHSVVRTADGYEVKYVPPPYYRFWKRWDNPFLLTQGEPAHCFTAIFAPRRMRVPVRHVWSFLHTVHGWQVTDRITFPVTGGRDGGYRGSSMKRRIYPGKWRVEVETYNGRILGSIDFEVVAISAPLPPMENRFIP